jgi:hypothetical protein
MNKGTEMKNKKLRLVDIIIILFCLLGAAGSFTMFWFGLFSPNSSNNEKPAGILNMKNNVIQRRPEDRVLWGRLALNSPVYFGDLILVTESSSATLNIDDNYINLNENTLIRIQRRTDKGAIQIDLEEGYIEIHPDKGIISGRQGVIPVINAGGSKVAAEPGTVLSIEARRDGGVEVQVIEGSAVMSAGNGKMTDFKPKELSAGTKITLDAEGTERLIPGAMVTRPRSSAQYLKNEPEPFSVDFMWNRINLEPDRTLRLEIAIDQNFNRIFSSIDSLYETAKVSLNEGYWYWRLCFETTVLASGQLTIAEADGPELISPPKETTILYRDEFPLLRFQWSERKEALSYLLEISETPDFAGTLVSRPVDSVFFVETDIGPGTWYWRVLPVFPNTYNGGVSYSSVSILRIEQHSGMKEERIVEPPVLTEPEEAAPIVLPEVRLLSPAQGTRLAGLTALRNQTVFSWEYSGEAAKTRFVLSRSANPLQGRPQVERLNPGSSVRLNRLEEGNWYWTVEVETPEGNTVRADQPRQLRVLPIPVLPAPEDRRPVSGTSIGVEELKTQRNIIFSWSAVQGANGYFFTLYREADGKRQKITGNEQPMNSTSWTLENLNILDRGNFIWQIEAVNTSGGRIDQRGRTGENTFNIDIPRPGQVLTEEPSILE